MEHRIADFRSLVFIDNDNRNDGRIVIGPVETFCKERIRRFCLIVKRRIQDEGCRIELERRPRITGNNGTSQGSRNSHVIQYSDKGIDRSIFPDGKLLVHNIDEHRLAFVADIRSINLAHIKTNRRVRCTVSIFDWSKRQSGNPANRRIRRIWRSLDDIAHSHSRSIIGQSPDRRNTLDDHVISLHRSNTIRAECREAANRQDLVHLGRNSRIHGNRFLVVIHDDVVHRVARIRIAVPVRRNSGSQVEYFQDNAFIIFLERIVLGMENNRIFQRSRVLREFSTGGIPTAKREIRKRSGRHIVYIGKFAEFVVLVAITRRSILEGEAVIERDTCRRILGENQFDSIATHLVVFVGLGTDIQVDYRRIKRHIAEVASPEVSIDRNLLCQKLAGKAIVLHKLDCSARNICIR